MSSRSGLRAEARARSARVDAETETFSGLRTKGGGRTRRRGAGGAARSPVYREQPGAV